MGTFGPYIGAVHIIVSGSTSPLTALRWSPSCCGWRMVGGGRLAEKGSWRWCRSTEYARVAAKQIMVSDQPRSRPAEANWSVFRPPFSILHPLSTNPLYRNHLNRVRWQPLQSFGRADILALYMPSRRPLAATLGFFASTPPPPMRLPPTESCASHPFLQAFVDERTLTADRKSRRSARIPGPCLLSQSCWIFVAFSPSSTPNRARNSLLPC